MADNRDVRALAFNDQLIALIQKHYPGAIKGDIEDNSQAAAAIAVAMGGLLAFAFRLNGEVVGRGALQTIVQRIVENATVIDQRAGDIIRNNLPKIIH